MAVVLLGCRPKGWATPVSEAGTAHSFEPKEKVVAGFPQLLWGQLSAASSGVGRRRLVSLCVRLLGGAACEGRPRIRVCVSVCAVPS